LANASLVLKPYLDSLAACPGLALIATQQLRKRRLRRRIGLGVARPRGQPTQLHPMQQPVGARQRAINVKLLLQYALRVDPTKMPIPRPAPARRQRQSVTSTARSLSRRPAAVDPGAAGHAIPQCRPLHGGYAIRKPPTGSAEPAARLPHAPSPLACSRSAEPAGTPARSRVVPSAAAFAAPGSLRKNYAGIVHPPNMVYVSNHSTTFGCHRKPVLGQRRRPRLSGRERKTAHRHLFLKRNLQEIGGS